MLAAAPLPPTDPATLGSPYGVPCRHRACASRLLRSGAEASRRGESSDHPRLSTARRRRDRDLLRSCCCTTKFIASERNGTSWRLRRLGAFRRRSSRSTSRTSRRWRSRRPSTPRWKRRGCRSRREGTAERPRLRLRGLRLRPCRPSLRRPGRGGTRPADPI